MKKSSNISVSTSDTISTPSTKPGLLYIFSYNHMKNLDTHIPDIGEHIIVPHSFRLTLGGAMEDNHPDDTVVWTMIRSESKVLNILEKWCHMIKERQIMAMRIRALHNISPEEHSALHQLISDTANYLAKNIWTPGFWEEHSNLHQLQCLAIIERRTHLLAKYECDSLNRRFFLSKFKPPYVNETTPISVIASEMMRITSYRWPMPKWMRALLDD